MISLSELALTARLKLGDRRAFEALVRQHQSSLRRFFLHLTLGNQMLSDDLAQDTFIKAFRKMDQFSGMSSFQTWLFRIAYNTWYDYNRSRHIKESDLETVRMETESSGDVGLRMDLLKAMSCLKDVERSCITLHVIEGRKTEEISQIMEINASTVRGHIFRGKQKLAEYLIANGYER